MPSLFNVTDVSRVVTAKPHHVHFVCGEMTAGSITCSALTVNGNPSVVDISGLVNLETGTLTGSLASFLNLQASSLSVMKQLSVNGSIQANTLSSAMGAFSSVSCNNMMSTILSVTGLLTTGTTNSSLCTAANMIATSLQVYNIASVTQVLAAGTINASVGSLTSLYAMAGTISQATMDSISATSAGFQTCICNNIQGSALSVNGNVSVTGTLTVGSILGGPAKFSSISASASSISSVMFAGTATAALGNFSLMIGSGIVLSGNATVTGSISATNFSGSSASLATLTGLTGSMSTFRLSSLTSSSGSFSTVYTTSLTGNVLNVLGAGPINLGSDVVKANNSGCIGYQLATPGALDVYGAGTLAGLRNVKVWDNMTVPGTINANSVVMSGSLSVPSFAPVWIPVGTFLNSWSAYTGQTPPSYWKDPFGVVHLRGLVKNTTSTSGACFILPSGYIPVNFAYFSCSNSNPDATSITVCISPATSSGSVTAGSVLISTSTLTVALDGVTFATS